MSWAIEKYIGVTPAWVNDGTIPPFTAPMEKSEESRSKVIDLFDGSEAVIIPPVKVREKAFNFSIFEAEVTDALLSKLRGYQQNGIGIRITMGNGEKLKDARKRKFDILLVWKFDRFARSTKHLVTALEELEGLGIDFCSYEDSIDTSTNHGKLVFTIMGAIAEFERSLIRERVLSGLRRAKENGIRLGRPPLDIDVDKIKELALNGNSVRAIAKEMGISKSLVHKTLVLSPLLSRYSCGARRNREICS